MAEALALQIIETLPAHVRRVTLDMSPEQARVRPAEGEWSAVEVVGHLCDHMEVWGERFRRIAAESSPYLPAFDQETYVRERDYQQQDLAALQQRLTELCAATVAALHALPSDSWSKSGTHEERGILTLDEATRICAAALPEHVLQLVGVRDSAERGSIRLPGRPSGR